MNNVGVGFVEARGDGGRCGGGDGGVRRRAGDGGRRSGG